MTAPVVMAMVSARNGARPAAGRAKKARRHCGENGEERDGEVDRYRLGKSEPQHAHEVREAQFSAAESDKSAGDPDEGVHEEAPGHDHFAGKALVDEQVVLALAGGRHE
jgi:hypothetical protein